MNVHNIKETEYEKEELSKKNEKIKEENEYLYIKTGNAMDESSKKIITIRYMNNYKNKYNTRI